MGKGDKKRGMIEGKEEPHSVGFELEAVGWSHVFLFMF